MFLPFFVHDAFFCCCLVSETYTDPSLKRVWKKHTKITLFPFTRVRTKKKQKKVRNHFLLFWYSGVRKHIAESLYSAMCFGTPLYQNKKKVFRFFAFYLHAWVGKVFLWCVIFLRAWVRGVYVFQTPDTKRNESCTKNCKNGVVIDNNNTMKNCKNCVVIDD